MLTAYIADITTKKIDKTTMYQFLREQLDNKDSGLNKLKLIAQGLENRAANFSVADDQNTALNELDKELEGYSYEEVNELYKQLDLLFMNRAAQNQLS